MNAWMNVYRMTIYMDECMNECLNKCLNVKLSYCNAEYKIVILVYVNLKIKTVSLDS